MTSTDFSVKYLNKDEKINFNLSITAVRELFEAAVKIDKDLAN